MSTTHIGPAVLSWDENGQPISTEFDDVYFSKSSGLDETRYVFLQHNDLPERFTQLNACGFFTIAETGFGTGLNFLCAMQSFLENAPDQARLHFISVEKSPLTRRDLEQALTLWPELKHLADELINNYPGNIPGFHRRHFARGRVQLTLIVDDVVIALSTLDARVNAWFLDGFAPSKNPQMWQPELFQTMAEKSAANATYATFTVARIVRGGLSEAGFTLERASGFGRKREMLKGHLEKASQNQQPAPWLKKQISPKQQTALVIGAGIAGASTARALADRGWQVTIIDSHKEPASGASGNPQGILYARLSVHDTPLSQLVLQGYRHTINLLKHAPKEIYSLSGLIQLPDNEKELQRHQALNACGRFDAILEGLSSEKASRLSGIEYRTDGLFFHDGGWVNPPGLVNWLLDHPNISFTGEQTVCALAKEQDIWKVVTTEGQPFQSPVVVIACGHLAAKLTPTSHIPLKAIRGQITEVPSTPESERLNWSLCAEGYIAPAHNGRHTLGATFNFNDPDTSVRPADHKANLDTVSSFAPELAQALEFNQLDPKSLSGRTGFRCTTPDYLPVIGPVMDEPVFKREFAILAKNAKAKIPEAAPWLKGLYINAGHGSRGMITCPLSGEIIASHITGETAPVSKKMMTELHPERFTARRLIKGKNKT
ncbi:bifunctional tRNA (5-methylaminomethyl-2-thiouridine)(34)-methyltransferase MnmD/FAD-dependent 5-carboxymethylaminomethyl-2-thiouridine(34) oxidoreductase MnmC [Sansalvadorimonas sp. 2012CJ34-2]|uniref:tRNA 5-methylaminomethyl-2-thiouridine biosynthesis bifunctional protein MnmC n=1 Tax=Parendozoicomonas callyspongiae TaxID=2942213 RepID=A0ABT0PKE4_9GAMM|nr:bifunctional tRNA (5-methylaminomethyl-2-thiouridine)(34)-methyltransferase MnmD/FAD-dependent 5-carboxymethylaminomethyl-2-thiouridine(34) oxidoreductase MnmC [Sansalvadorimonas sp. 2012CJ34-2]MCL6271862.1 bifunctional tRNA (5-methylaminomethyl-2-thiouridine)(34)-methyltransferase MnmD/FAD-dependent 5-carboxymethylaminomethyl-2-thiouridine(34) oxidoreductase MnmC [Sansalvadorimonas sp. 2012CJ34-2]